MPRRRKPIDEEDDDSEFDLTQSQSRSQNRTKSQKTTQERPSQSSESISEYVRKTIKMVLQYAVTKYPVKRAELVNQAMNGNTHVFALVYEKAKEKLADKYQLDLIELKESKVKQYIVVSKQPAFAVEEYTEEQIPQLVLLYLILEYIYMKNGEVSVNTMYEYLARFEISFTEEHEYFGDVKHLVHDVFTKQLYLNFVKNVAEGSNVEKITVKWGERAENEIIKREMLDFVANFLDCNPSVFLQQYEEAYGTEVETQELEENVSNLQMSSQPKQTRQPKRRGRRSAPMEVDSD